MSTPPALECKGISKSFGMVAANQQVDFRLGKGEIHALLGENGAGKSTLMNIISGLVQPDAGEIRVHGRRVNIRNPRAAIRLGIGMVHQHFMLIPGFTTLENVVLGAEPGRGLTIDVRAAQRKLSTLSDEYGLSVDPQAVTEDQPVGVQQRVEIVKALYRDADILILDEPTAVLTARESAVLFRIMRKLARDGVSIVLITHKLREVMQVADSITVLQRGRVSGVVQASDAGEPALVRMMIGREVGPPVRRKPGGFGRVVFQADKLRVRGSGNRDAVVDVSFSVRRGEIVGVAGIQGNGQTELAEAIAGLRRLAGGEIRLGDRKMPTGSPRKMMENGLAHIPEDRLKHGLVPSFSIADNQVLCSYYRKPYIGFWGRDHDAVFRHSRRLMERYDIRATGPEEPVERLSGGNQQKVILSREFSRDAVLLLANQPTRGLDVGSIAHIHRQLMDLRESGLGVLLISSELEEVFQLSDFILVMVAGRIAARVRPEDTTPESVGLLMTNGRL